MIHCYLRELEVNRKKHLINVLTPEEFINPILVANEARSEWIPIHSKSSIYAIESALIYAAFLPDKTLAKKLFELSDNRNYELPSM